MEAKKFLLILVFSIVLTLLVWYQVGTDGINTEEYCNDMSLSEAKEIAIASECGDKLKENHFCNEYTNTWWIDLDLEKEGCAPACVINIETKQAEINWRCTGLVV